MDWQTIHQQALTFLRTEKQSLQHKVTQRGNGFRSSNHHNGFDGCCAAEWDLDVLESIIAAQQAPDALSLESALLCQEADLERQIAAIPWRRGKPSPPDYWRLECQRAYVGDLLRRYHAFRRNGTVEER